MSIVVVEIAIVLALFVANGVFAISEMAVVSSRKSRLKQMAEAGNLGAAAALRLVEAPNRFQPTVRIGITLIGLHAGAFSGATLASELGARLKPLPEFTPYAEVVYAEDRDHIAGLRFETIDMDRISVDKILIERALATAAPRLTETAAASV